MLQKALGSNLNSLTKMVSTMILFLVMILIVKKIVLLKVKVYTNEAIGMAITMKLNDAMVRRNLKG